MNRYYLHIIAVVCVLLLAGCQELGLLVGAPGTVSEPEKDEGVVIRKLTFSEDLRFITAKVDQMHNFGSNHLDDTSKVRIVVKDYNGDDTYRPKLKQPEVISVRNTEQECIREKNVNILAMLDLTLGRDILDKQRKVLEDIRYTFSRDNLFLTFMLPGGELSAIYPATPYILNTYTSPLISPLMRDVPENPHSFLYRSLVTVIQEVSERKTSCPLDSTAFTSIIVFSGSEVYDRNTNLPYDPEHYEYQEMLIHMARTLPSDLEISYICQDEQHPVTGTDGLAELPDINIMKMLCNSSGGSYLENFDWGVMKEHIKSRMNLDVSDFEILLRNRDGQMYVGNVSRMEFLFYDTRDSLLTSAAMEYILGGADNLMVVGPAKLRSFILKGVMAGMFVLLLMFLVFQIAVPFAQYVIFRQKHVVRYRGPNMTVNKVAIPDRCYMCKAPFRKDDSIVVKCAHVVHEECWEENDCHCPEYGRGCRDGSHFYDRHNLFDRRNASFYMIWVLVAATVAILSWLMFMTSYHTDFYDLLSGLYEWLYSLMNNSLTARDRTMFALRCYYVPVMAIHLSSYLVLGLSAITVHRRIWYLRLADILSRVLAAGLVTSVIFLMFSSAVIVFRMSGSSLTVLPWTVTSLVVAFLSTYRTRIKPDSRYVYAALGVGLVCAFIWKMFIGMESASDISNLLIAYFFFSVGIALSVARALPHRERYFLHVSGPVKEMDIALYKWFVQKPDAIVSIGKSVDCSIQITWDLKSRISPVQAEVRLDKGLPRLYVVDDTVTLNGEKVPPGRPVRLYHNDAFVIGLTAFRYVEI